MPSLDIQTGISSFYFGVQAMSFSIQISHE